MKIYFCFLLLLLAFVFKLSSQGKMLSLDRNLNTSASFDLALWCKCNSINYCKKYEPSKGYAQDNKYIIPGKDNLWHISLLTAVLSLLHCASAFPPRGMHSTLLW